MRKIHVSEGSDGVSKALRFKRKIAKQDENKYIGLGFKKKIKRPRAQHNFSQRRF